MVPPQLTARAAIGLGSGHIATLAARAAVTTAGHFLRDRVSGERDGWARTGERAAASSALPVRSEELLTGAPKSY